MWRFHLRHQDRHLCGFLYFPVRWNQPKNGVISTPFGLYQYHRLHMGLTNSPDVIQSTMYPLFQDIPQVDVFIDDIGIFTNSSFEHHLSVLHQVLLRLDQYVFTANPLKCAWANTQTTCLGFLLTSSSVKPIPKKIMHVMCPTSVKCVRSFIGLVNYNKDRENFVG